MNSIHKMSNRPNGLYTREQDRIKAATSEKSFQNPENVFHKNENIQATVQTAIDAYNNVYEAEIHLSGGMTDNQEKAMLVALQAVGAIKS